VETPREKQEPRVITIRLEAGRIYKLPSVRLANPADAGDFRKTVETVEARPNDGR